MEPTEITAGRLHLRPWQPGDEDYLLAHYGDPETQRWTSRPLPYLPEHATDFVRRLAVDGWASGTHLTWAVCDSTTGAVLADVHLRPGCGDGIWDIGYGCHPAARGQRVVPDAVGAVCRWAFAALEARRVAWMSQVGNWPSRRAAEKAGFRVEGVLRGGLPRRGEHVDAWIGGLLPADPQEDVPGRRGAPPELRTERLRLRPWRADDDADLARLLDEPEIARWTPHPSPYRRRDAQERIADDAAQWAAGTRAELAVLDAATDELVGTVGLYRVQQDCAEIGWATSAAARGRGIAGEAVEAICGWAFDQPGLQRLQASVLVGNWASRRVAERAGFRFEGVTRWPASEEGEPRDLWILARLADDPAGDTAVLPPYGEQSDGVVTLRRWRPSDAAEVARACADPDIARWLPVPVPYTLEVARGFVDGIVPAEWAAGTNANVAVVDAVDGGLLGAAGLRVRDGIGEVGYWTAPWARGRGVAGRAARLHAAWGFAALGLPRVELLADVDNVASQRVADKAGFTREGVGRALRAAPRDAGTRRDMVVYARLPRDA